MTRPSLPCTEDPTAVVPTEEERRQRRVRQLLARHPDWALTVERGPTPIEPEDWRRCL